MNYAICWKGLIIIIVTYIIRGLDRSRISENTIIRTQSAGNQRRDIQSQVGTSETTRVTPFDKKFCEWLAGVIDGDGCLQVSKQGYTSLEITMGLEDLALLRYIQDKLGGSVKLRSGVKAYRYRLHNKEGMRLLIKCINGEIRHSTRLNQLHKVCQVLGEEVIKPNTITKDSNWFAGFFDADGTITMSMKQGRPQLSIRVSQKLHQDIECYLIHLGGNIYFDSSQTGCYVWSIQSREDVLHMLKYFKASTFRSSKSKRFHLIEDYYRLVDLKAWKVEGQLKAWQDWLDRWNGIKGEDIVHTPGLGE